MQRETIVFLDTLALSSSQVKRLEKFGSLMRYEKDWPNDKEVIVRATPATILVSKWVYISEKIFSHAPKLKFVVMAMTGYHDWVDIKAAQRRNIAVSNVIDFSTEAVAEHTLLLMLAVAKKLNPSFLDVRKGIFNPKDSPYLGFELKGKSLGIVGYGHIGKRLGELAQAVEMHVSYVDSKSTKEQFHTLLQKSQILSIHTPLTNLTHHLIGESELKMLPEGAVVINTSRGKVIDEKALIEALKNGHLTGAGLDVFDCEPIEKNNPLLSMNNVILTPHIAYATEESYARLSEGVVRNIEAFVAGKPINIVT